MQTLLLYGASIFIEGLAGLLLQHPEVRVEARQHLTDLGDLAVFDAVIVDLNNPKTSDVLTLLRARPDLTVIGVNTAGGAVTVLSGRVYLAHSLADVLDCLE